MGWVSRVAGGYLLLPRQLAVAEAGTESLPVSDREFGGLTAKDEVVLRRQNLLGLVHATHVDHGPVRVPIASCFLLRPAVPARSAVPERLRCNLLAERHQRRRAERHRRLTDDQAPDVLVVQ